MGERKSLPEYPLTVLPTVSVSYFGVDYKADIQYDENKVTATLTSPEVLKGLVISSDESGTKIQNALLTLSYQNGYLEKICPFAELYGILTALNTQCPEIIRSGEELTADFDCDGDCTAKINPESGKLKEIKTKKYIFTFN